MPQIKKNEEKSSEEKLLDPSIIQKYLTSGYNPLVSKSNIHEKLVDLHLFKNINTSNPSLSEIQKACDESELYLQTLSKENINDHIDLLEHLILLPNQDAVLVDEKFSTSYTYRNNGSVVFESVYYDDDEKEEKYYSYEISLENDDLNPDADFAKTIKKLQKHLTNLIPKIPSGNLGGIKGIRRIIEQFFRVEMFNKYLND